MRSPILLLLALSVVQAAFAVKASAAADPAVLRVEADGTGDHATIQEAVDAAQEAAVVQIGPGVWKESVRITKPLTLEGAGWQATRIVSEAQGQPQAGPELIGALERITRELDAETQAKLREAFMRVYGSAPALTIHAADGVVIRNITCLRSEPVRTGSFKSEATVDIRDAAVQMEDCAILESPGIGLTAAGDSRVVVAKCLIANCWGNGVTVAVSEQGTFAITDCDIRNNGYSGLSIGSPSQSITVTRCRIHGTGWHGIRYDACSPTIERNLFYRTAVSGIYASGDTHARVQNNLFYHSGISCWFQNADAIQANTFVGDHEADDGGGITQGLQVLGASQPTVRQNILVTCENAVYLGDIGSDSPHAKSSGEVQLIENVFWNNQRDLARRDAAGQEYQAIALPEGNRQQQPAFVNPDQRDFCLEEASPLRKAGIGAQEFPSFDSPWPLQPEEQRTIASVEARIEQTAGQR
jgi:hypothetical protein